MKIVGIVKVRMGSSRLPGKPLIEVAEKPLLLHLVERLRLCKSLDEIVVATSTEPGDDAIAHLCRDHDINVFRGSENDVLARMLAALEVFDADIGVDVFGDQPLIDPKIVDGLVEIFLRPETGCDWVGNDLVTTFPPGMDMEVFTLDALRLSDKMTDDPAVREHGTLYIRQHPETFKLLNVEAPAHLRRPEVELEVDTLEDLLVISEILNHFIHRPGFSCEDCLDFLDRNPEISEANRYVPRRWKMFREKGSSNA